jgi:soluble lytic murein transglycosylase
MLLAAAEGARRQGWHDRAIFAADRTRQLHNYGLRYLTPYREIVEKNARTEKLDPAWVYGLMRQESRFISEAKSGVGARGLMQLMPATAKWVGKKLGWKKFDVNDVSDNVALGSRYLNEIWRQLSSSQVLASAGYNAGPGRARAWQADRPLEAAIYIENIPFAETRDYVKKVMANAMHYAPAFGSEAGSLKARIGTIPAKGTSVNNLP